MLSALTVPNFLRMCFHPTMSVNMRGVSPPVDGVGLGHKLDDCDMTGFSTADTGRLKCNNTLN